MGKIKKLFRSSDQRPPSYTMRNGLKVVAYKKIVHHCTIPACREPFKAEQDDDILTSRYMLLEVILRITYTHTYIYSTCLSGAY